MKGEDCIFCKIVNNEISRDEIYEDGHCIAMLDKFPATKGQSLVISKKHIPYIFDLDDDTYNHLFKITKKISKAIDKTLKPKRICIMVEGFDIPHTHIRIHPTYGKGIERNGKEISREESKSLTKQIKDNIK